MISDCRLEKQGESYPTIQFLNWYYGDSQIRNTVMDDFSATLG